MTAALRRSTGRSRRKAPHPHRGRHDPPGRCPSRPGRPVFLLHGRGRLCRWRRGRRPADEPGRPPGGDRPGRLAGPSDSIADRAENLTPLTEQTFTALDHLAAAEDEAAAGTRDTVAHRAALTTTIVVGLCPSCAPWPSLWSSPAPKAGPLAVAAARTPERPSTAAALPAPGRLVRSTTGRVGDPRKGDRLIGRPGALR